MVSVGKFDFKSDKILSSLSPTDKQRFLKFAEHLKFKKRKLIFYEGGVPTGVFLISKGRAKIHKLGADGKDQIFYIYKSGDMLGYHALLCDEKYEDSCEALEDCEMLFIEKSQFEQLLNEIPRLKLLLIQNMSHEFGVLVNTITVLTRKSLRERLALNLLILNEKYKDDDVSVVEIKLPREDLANIIGTVRESLGRLLKEFKYDGLIEIQSKTIIIKNHNVLTQIANSKHPKR